MSTDLGGLIEVDAEVAAVVEASAATLAAAGARVEAAHPDLALAEDTFRTLRAWSFQAGFRDLLAEHPDEFKPSLADNIRAGEGLTGADVARAYRQLTALAETARLFFEAYDVLLLPTSQVPPFPADQEYPADINGKPMATYLDWMRSAYLITVTGCPADLGPGRTDQRRAPGRRPARRAARRRPPAARGRGRVRGPRRWPDLHRQTSDLWMNAPYLWRTRRKTVEDREFPEIVGDSLLRAPLATP